MERSSGILMHISSLPGKYGIGTFGRYAYKFVDFLKKSGQKYWQILPLGQTGYGDSPYQCFSAFAGNPYFIDFDILEEEGLLNRYDYENLDYGYKEDFIEYSKLYINKNKVLRIAFSKSKGRYEEELKRFIAENNIWLEDYALYMALKQHFNLESWHNWHYDIKVRNEGSMNYYKNILKDEIDYWIFVQYLFYKQWSNLKAYANKNGVKVIGDMPIYVSEDSSDIWSNPKYFNVDNNMKLKTVAGCPPDAFSPTGQLWGNPIYNWEALENDGYNWWIDRVRESFKLYDVVRIDHFRGFDSYWEIPYGNNTAEKGVWKRGPGKKLFKAIKDKLGDLEIIAEDLGMITEDVIKLREYTGFPGMKILQFSFGGNDDKDLPHNYPVNSVAYTGTHDNDTVYGWYCYNINSLDVRKARKYLNLSYEEGIAKGLIRGVWESPSYLAITTIQDFLSLGSEARMNFPSTLGRNWTWRLTENQINDSLAQEIYDLTKRCNR